MVEVPERVTTDFSDSCSFFIDLLIVSHSILIGRSFSAYDGLIQYQWAAHSVPFVRAGLMY